MSSSFSVPSVQTTGQKFDKCIADLCTLLTPPLLTGSIALLVSPAGPWKTYPIVLSVLFLFVITTINCVRTVWKQEWFKKALMFPKKLLQGTIITWLLHLELNLQKSTIGNIIMWVVFFLSLLNMYWFYIQTRDLLHGFYKTLVSFIVYFTDPIEVLKEFENLLRTMKVYAFCEWLRQYYVDPTIVLIEKGGPWVLVKNSLLCMFLVFIALLFYTTIYGEDEIKLKEKEDEETVELENKINEFIENKPNENETKNRTKFSSRKRRTEDAE